MAPILSKLLARSSRFLPGEATEELSNQWTHPGDCFSILLILGGDVVAFALARLSGKAIGPPSFSFGWVAYAIKALTAVVSDNRLMPPADCSCLVVHGGTGYARSNTSWILGRVVRDYDTWMEKTVRERVDSMIETNWQIHRADALKNIGLEPPRPTRVGLCISIYEADPTKKIGIPDERVLYSLSALVAVLQLSVATIPFALFGNWSILLVTICGIALSSATASIPQWRAEKWACRRLRKGSNKKTILTRGNGSQHAIVVLGCEGFLDLEDLATGQTNFYASTSMPTRIALVVLAVLWTLLLVTAAGLTENTWFLLMVGGIGILFNVYVAGRSSDPWSSGIPLKFKSAIANPKVMDALYAAEKEYPQLGRSMLGIFFPGRLRQNEIEAWDEYDRVANEEKLDSHGKVIIDG